MARSQDSLEKKYRVAAMDDQFRDFKRFLPALRMRMIFDVGANIGQSTRAFRQAFPKARIFAFEPVQQSFELLQAECREAANTQCFNLALGDEPGRVTMQVSGVAVRNRIVAQPQGRTPEAEVAISTGDAFCAEHGIGHIDFLKIDAEGYDLKVCAGFAQMIARKEIELVQVEVGMNVDNKTHVPLQAFVDFFAPHGYLIFRLYDQVLHPRQPRLRRANAVFVSPSQYEKPERPSKRRGSPSLASL